MLSVYTRVQVRTVQITTSYTHALHVRKCGQRMTSIYELNFNLALFIYTEC